MKEACVALALAVAALPAFARNAGPEAQPATVKQLLDSGQDEQFVIVRGHLLRRVDSKTFQFADATGSLLVEIEPKSWPNGSAVNEKVLVELIGKYDLDVFAAPELDVKQLRIIE